MPRVGIYCRLSIEDKDRLQGVSSQSIQNQRAMLCDYCKVRGWEISGIYCDDGYSGIDRSRPEFNRLLADCEAGRIDIVLCKDQSRFSRDIVVIEQILNDRFLEWGVRFIGVADNADTESESYSTMRLFTSAYNEMYVKDISAKIRRTLAFKREQGQFVGAFAPYGYRIDPQDRHRLCPDPETAPVVQQIFALYLQGASYRRIAQTLNAQGIPSPAAYKQQSGSQYVNRNAEKSASHGLWTQSTISRLLANETYTGTLVQGKSHHISYKNKKRKQVAPADWVRIPDAHEALIDRDSWDRTQARLQSHTRVGAQSAVLPPLSGKVRCAVCGRPMKRNVYYNRAHTIRYYGLQCASHKSGAMNCPNHKSISGLELERLILDELNRLVARYCDPQQLRVTPAHEEQIKRCQKQLAALSERRQTAQEHLVAMYKDKLDGRLSEADFTLFRERLHEEEQRLAAQLEALQTQLTALQTRQDAPAPAHSPQFQQLDRELADAFIDRIEIGQVDANGERDVHILWKL